MTDNTPKFKDSAAGALACFEYVTGTKAHKKAKVVADPEVPGVWAIHKAMPKSMEPDAIVYVFHVDVELGHLTTKPRR